MKTINSFRNQAHKHIIIRLSIAVIALLILLTLFTQYLGFKFSYNTALGSPLYGKFYNPFNGISWYLNYYQYYPNSFYEAVVVTGFGLGVIVLVGFLINIMLQRRLRFIKDLHGSAKFASFEEIKQMGFIQDDNNNNGVIIGGYQAGNFKYYLQSNSPDHAIMIAPPRSGKGVGVVIPTALTWQESMICMDLKGELWQLTAGARKAKGQKVLKFAPGSLEDNCQYNPLSEIRIYTEYAISDAQNLATIIIDPEGKGLDGYDGHWKKKGRAFISAIILHLLYLDKSANMTTIAYFISTDIENHLLEMRNNTHKQGARDEFVFAAADSLINTPDRERGSIISTAEAFFEIYKDPIVQRNTKHSDFGIKDLMNNEEPVTLYISVEPKDLIRLTPLLRILMTQIVLGLTDCMEFDQGKQIRKKHKLLLLWDEFTSIGRLEMFEKQLAYMPGYGIKALIIIQDISQLHRTYSKDESILSTCNIKMAFAPSKMDTAELLSRMTGTTTVKKEALTKSGGIHSPTLKHVSISTQEIQRPLMTADEILKLKSAIKDKDGMILEPGEMLIFIAGQSPIYGTQILFFDDPDFLRQTQISPPLSSESLSSSHK
ncbi:MAG: type IV secretory system conjugative DNA transfer family protein [Proteobacteria bacterium]|nr:type IV secretory system conjugative DNA transfer family protein [Pseudomonadota bacterium]MBU1586272.1 type IV secretory system conjugative DNA transfer family protein [Pseudomonadota bacterium]MBU2453168.1 type IV secretory system conjugative DNA transfer family protein [Pseudomonadota bacterium]MBU2630801.1 type IV secretory system conjugative DNA transfer family protein [Pseudomonadota bacterium]